MYGSGIQQKIIKVDKEATEKIEKLTTQQVREKRNKKDSLWCLYDNYLIDIGDYLSAHPGGRNLLFDSLYQDVTRYVNGSVPYNSKFDAWSHNYLTCKYAIQQLAFAEIKDDHKIIIDSNESSMYIYDDANLVKSRVTAGVTNEFSFQISSNIKQCRYARYLEGFSWMGRHFAIYSKGKDISRLYSLCLAANEKVHEIHKQILDNIYSVEKGQSATIRNLSEAELYSSDLELYVKRYDYPKAFSLYLHKGKIPENDLVIKGPMGLGLDLEDNLDGTYISFSAGTGIYCFLDFVAVTVRKVCDEVSKKLGISNNTLIPNEKFNLGENFKLILYCSYSDEENAFWHDIFEKTSALDEKYNIGIFKYFPRISTQKTKRWNGEFFSSTFKQFNTQNIQKVFLCGPAPFLDSVKSDLIAEKLVKEDIITLV